MIPANQNRLAAIDILRALTMLLMIFVNDLWSLQDVPKWLLHTEAQEDGMGFSDIIFPAFLVIVGMSVPFSVASRRAKGEATSSIILHILLRSLALLVMGLFLVNGENISESGSGMPRLLWSSLCCISFIFIWNAYPKTIDKRLIVTLKIIGWLILFILAWLYRGGDDASLRFETLWWGILGLIGWAYLVSALVYVAFGSNLISLTLFFIFCISFCIASHADFIPKDSLLATLTSPVASGAMPAFVTAGMISSILFTSRQKQNKPYQLIGLLILISVILMIAGFYFRQFWGISKIRATPSWVLICSGITIASFAVIYWFADLKQQKKWFDPIKPAGTNTLLCYLLPYFAYALVYGVLQTQYPESISTGFVGLVKSFLFAFVIVQLAGLLGKAGIRLKL